MENPKVSIVVPVFRAEPYIRECLDSMIDQSYQNLEIILIDDGSPDRCGSICDEYAEKDGRIKVIHQENGGVSSARNMGIACASGTYITFVDADDWIEPGHIASLTDNILRTGAECAVCGYWEDHPRGRSRRAVSRYDRLSGSKAMEKMLMPELFQGFLWNKIFRMNLIREKGLRLQADLTHYEDLLFCAGYFFYASKICLVSAESYHYRQHSGSAIGYREVNERWLAGRRSAVAALERVYPFCQTRASRSLCLARQQMEYADMLRRITAGKYRVEGSRELKAKVFRGTGKVLFSPLKVKHKLKYLSTVLFPACAARFWVRREDRAFLSK